MHNYSSIRKRSVRKDDEKAKYKSDCLIADETNSVKLVLWEGIIDRINAGKTYHFKQLKLGIFDDVKYLNTSEATDP